MACMTPFIVKQQLEGRNIPVPCGKCPECLKRRTSNWSFRLMQEDKRAVSAHFVTLTYDTEYVPITKNGFMGLCKRDVQLFFKRLRKIQNLHKPFPVPIKYYVAGEYGSQNKRPHYHAIIFNADIECIERAWQRGFVHYGTVSGASVGYTLKYMSKEPTVPMHSRDDRLKEFSLMSKGLGANYLTEKMIAWHEADINNRCYINIEDGKKIAMPRYFKDKIYTKEQREHMAMVMQQKFLIEYEKRQAEMEQLHGDRASEVQVEIDKNRFKKMYSSAIKNRNL